jgi:hypothetical protein
MSAYFALAALRIMGIKHLNRLDPFAARLRARRILYCFRDAVAVTAPCHAPLYHTPTLIVRRFGTSTWEDLGLAAYSTAVCACAF